MKKKHRRTRKTRTYPTVHTVLFGSVALLSIPIAVLAIPSITKTNYQAEEVFLNETQTLEGRSVIEHVETPASVKSIYMTSCVAGTPNFREGLVSLIESTELNSVVIDIKDYSGTVSFPVKSSLLLPAWQNARCGARDMQSFIEELHEKGIYVIGRITVFQDPFYTNVRPDLAVKRASNGGVWHDYKGLSFIDVGAKEYWDYIVLLSEESFNIGFDELNFDYIRYPSDGNMEDIAFTLSSGSKPEQLEKFFVYLSEHVKDTSLYQGIQHEGLSVPVISADLFGMTTTNTDDLNIGQVLERTLPHFDFVSPMVYPSHYPPTFNGWDDPNLYPYDVVYYSMSSAALRAAAATTTVKTLGGTPIYYTTQIIDPITKATSTQQIFSGFYSRETSDKSKLRPWLQDFDYGGDYDVEEVQAQIQATYSAGLNSWMLWAPSNVYTTGALAPSSFSE